MLPRGCIHGGRCVLRAVPGRSRSGRPRVGESRPERCPSAAGDRSRSVRGVGSGLHRAAACGRATRSWSRVPRGPAVVRAAADPPAWNRVAAPPPAPPSRLRQQRYGSFSPAGPRRLRSSRSSSRRPSEDRSRPCPRGQGCRGWLRPERSTRLSCWLSDCGGSGVASIRQRERISVGSRDREGARSRPCRGGLQVSGRPVERPRPTPPSEAAWQPRGTSGAGC